MGIFTKGSRSMGCRGAWCWGVPEFPDWFSTGMQGGGVSQSVQMYSGEQV